MTTLRPKRNLSTVLSHMIRVIPTNGEEDDFKNQLESQLEKLLFTAPENIHNIWCNVQYIINERFKATSIIPEWSNSLLDTWMDKL